jgi:protein-L-isoaspartate(D-aspartate) O-methyltransferase
VPRAQNRWVRRGVVAALLALGAAAMPAGCSLNSSQPGDLFDPVEARQRMVREQLVARGIRDRRVLEAMGRVSRHELVPESVRELAYEDRPLPIGFGQTISQPYIVAAMTEVLGLEGDERVLEIGTGSGYQAAVLAGLCREVFSIELEKALADRAREDLSRLGYANVHVRHGDGYRGWPEQAPFDAIVVTAAPDHVPPALVEQLAVGGRMILPVGRALQDLLLVTRSESGVHQRVLMGVRFVPMRGEAENGEPLDLPPSED